jgi:hypothetical protein
MNNNYDDKLNTLIDNLYEAKIQPPKEFNQYQGFLNHEVAYQLGQYVAKKLLTYPEKIDEITEQYLKSLTYFNLQNTVDAHVAFFRVLEKNVKHHPFIEQDLFNTEKAQHFTDKLVKAATGNNDYHVKSLTEQMNTWMKQSIVPNTGKKTKIHSFVHNMDESYFPLYQISRQYLDNPSEENEVIFTKAQKKYKEDIIYGLAIVSALKIANQEDMRQVSTHFAQALKKCITSDDSMDSFDVGLTNLSVYLKTYAHHLVYHRLGIAINTENIKKMGYTKLSLQNETVIDLAITLYDNLYQNTHQSGLSKENMPMPIHNFIAESVNFYPEKVEQIKESIEHHYQNQKSDSILNKIKDKRDEHIEKKHIEKTVKQNKNNI